MNNLHSYKVTINGAELALKQSSNDDDFFSGLSGQIGIFGRRFTLYADGSSHKCTFNEIARAVLEQANDPAQNFSTQDKFRLYSSLKKIENAGYGDGQQWGYEELGCFERFIVACKRSWGEREKNALFQEMEHNGWNVKTLNETSTVPSPPPKPKVLELSNPNAEQVIAKLVREKSKATPDQLAAFISAVNERLENHPEDRAFWKELAAIIIGCPDEADSNYMVKAGSYEIEIPKYLIQAQSRYIQDMAATIPNDASDVALIEILDFDNEIVTLEIKKLFIECLQKSLLGELNLSLITEDKRMGLLTLANAYDVPWLISHITNTIHKTLDNQVVDKVYLELVKMIGGLESLVNSDAISESLVAKKEPILKLHEACCEIFAVLVAEASRRTELIFSYAYGKQKDERGDAYLAACIERRMIKCSKNPKWAVQYLLHPNSGGTKSRVPELTQKIERSCLETVNGMIEAEIILDLIRYTITAHDNVLYKKCLEFAVRLREKVLCVLNRSTPLEKEAFHQLRDYAKKENLFALSLVLKEELNIEHTCWGLNLDFAVGDCSTQNSYYSNKLRIIHAFSALPDKETMPSDMILSLVSHKISNPQFEESGIAGLTSLVELGLFRDVVGDYVYDAEAIALAVGIQASSSSVRRITLDGSTGDGAISVKGMIAIAQSLNRSQVEHLHIPGSSDLAFVGAISEALKTNKTLKYLSMHIGEINEQKATLLAEALRQNKTLETFMLKGDFLSFSALEIFMDGFDENKMLKIMGVPLLESNENEEEYRQQINQVKLKLNMSAQSHQDCKIFYGDRVVENKIIYK